MGRSFRASKTGIEKADKAFMLKGCTQEYLAGASGCNRQTVIKFFAGRPVEKPIFQNICNELNLDWGEIAELDLEDEQSSRGLSMNTTQETICETTNNPSAIQVLTPPVNGATQQTAKPETQLVITLTGNIESFLEQPDIQKALLVFMQKASGDTNIKIEKIEKGSIKITFSGSPESLKRLEELIKSGKLTEIEGMPIEDVKLLINTATEDERKLSLVQEIITTGAVGRCLGDIDLSDVDLSNADLSYVDLSKANLSNTDLSDADLTCANLSFANLSVANLSFANLSDTNLSSANLSHANLSDANLSSANLSAANLSSANLSDTNLRDADLNEADLNRANLNRADLSFANLSFANLSHADLNLANLSFTYLNDANLNFANLSGVNFSDAYLSDADLGDTDLSKANFSRAIVQNTLFRNNQGLTSETIADLKSRGAIFDDSPGNREFSPLTPRS